MRLATLLLLLALPASSQVRSARPYEGTSPGHPADEPGPELGASAEDALALLSRGDRDAARVSAARCLRADGYDHGCRLVVEAVEAGVEPPRVPPSGLGRLRAELHFQSGADYFFHGEAAGALREWQVCRRLDPGHGFCALGLRVLDAGGASARAPLRRWLPPPVVRRRAVPGDALDARRAYMAGVALFQKGDYAGARREWRACLDARPAGERRIDCEKGLEMTDALLGR